MEKSLEAFNTWPEFYSARVLSGEIYMENGQLEEALTAYKPGILLFKEDEPNRITDFPVGLWDKIKALETQLEK